MEESSDHKNHKALYWGGYFVLSVIGVWHGALLLSFILTLGVKEFEGARAISFFLLIPVMVIILVIPAIVLFVKKRNNLPVLKRTLVGLLVFIVISFGILEFVGARISILDFF